MTQVQVAQHPVKIGRVLAKSQGLTHYFTGVPCKHGHIAPRLVVNATCVLCGRASNKRDREKHGAKRNEVSKEWRKRNFEKYTSNSAAYYERNRESIRRKQNEYAKLNRDRALDRALKWEKRNPDNKPARVAKRRAARIQRVPPWSGELDQLVWAEAARLVRLRNSMSCVKWNADHVFPLRGAAVSGLHVGVNCQVIPAVLNRRKGNKIEMTHPSEWIRLT